MKIDKVLAPLLAALAACGPAARPGPPELPYVQVVSSNGRACSDFLAGAEIWAELGFAFGDVPSGLLECPRGWPSSPRVAWVDCQITVLASVEPHLIEMSGSDGLAQRDQRRIYVDDSLWSQHTDEYRLHTIAHEFGHVLLDTGEHTSGGLMSGDWTWLSMSDEDRALACEAIGVCL